MYININFDTFCSFQDYGDYDHKYTKNLPEIYDMFARWRTTMDEHMNRQDR